MKLHRLTMHAIGPFPGEIVIDFAQLGNSGLFLLEGPTGAGKSTVLDAVSFALYGKVSSSSSMADRLRSDHAPAGTEPVIELVFETQSGLYRIRRTPPYQRRKQRGSGEIGVTMTAKLFRLSSADDLDSGELMSNRLGEIDDEITHAVGLTHGQFVQTVLLPQGEFARFLRSDTNDKRALLQRLFGDELIARTQSMLVEQRRAALAQIETSTKAVTSSALSFAGAAGLSDIEHAEFAHLLESANYPAVAACASEVTKTIATTTRDLRTRSMTATQLRTTIVERLTGERDRCNRRQRRAELNRQRAALTAATADITAARSALADAERAVVVATFAQVLSDCVMRVDAAHQHLAQLQTQAFSLTSDPACTTDHELLAKQSAELRAEAGALRDIIRREMGFAQLQAQLSTLLTTAEVMQTRATAAGRQLGELDERQRALRENISVVATVASRQELLGAEVVRATQRLVAAEHAAQAEQAALRDQRITVEALEAEQRQADVVAQLNSQWRAGIAGQLGVALVDGDPCQVCGSPVHPQPAQPSTKSVSETDLAKAESEHQRLRSLAEDHRQQLDAQRAEHLTLLVAAESFTPERARGMLDEIEAQYATAVQAAQHTAELRAEAAAIETQQHELTAQLRELTQSQSDTDAAVLALRLHIGEDEELILNSRGGFDTVAEHASHLSAQAQQLEALGHAQHAVDAALTDAHLAGERFAEALTDAKFDSEDAWRRSCLPAAAITELRTTITHHDQHWATVASQLEAPELCATDLDEPSVDVDALAEQLDEADAAVSSILADLGAATDRLAESRRHRTQLLADIAHCAEVATGTEAAIRVGNLVAGNGENRLNMELTTFLLVRRFGEILSAANTELRTISRGRYTLEHSGEKQGNARSGLSLRIHDLYTGKSRDPASLSGGETFYVSLALALGLAEVVRSESGGIELGTLFIDEGFGSLDAEVLDDVIDVLDGLRVGGRTVGIVSHVSELKSRIVDQVQIRRNPDGSSRLNIAS